MTKKELQTKKINSGYSNKFFTKNPIAPSKKQQSDKNQNPCTPDNDNTTYSRISISQFVNYNLLEQKNFLREIILKCYETKLSEIYENILIESSKIYTNNLFIDCKQKIKSLSKEEKFDKIEILFKQIHKIEANKKQKILKFNYKNHSIKNILAQNLIELHNLKVITKVIIASYIKNTNISEILPLKY